MYVVVRQKPAVTRADAPGRAPRTPRLNCAHQYLHNETGPCVCVSLASVPKCALAQLLLDVVKRPRLVGVAASVLFGGGGREGWVRAG